MQSGFKRINGSAVPLYHGNFPAGTIDMEKDFHNIVPDVFYEHITYLQKHYKFIPIDEYITLKNLNKVASLTFDDGCKSIFNHALPILEDLQVPFSVFINLRSMRGQKFWRDRVRKLDQLGMVDEFEKFAPDLFEKRHKRFYRYTKDSVNNSRKVDEKMNEFFKKKGLDEQEVEYCIDNEQYFRDHPLVTYGNHTDNHYVLSSLSYDEQYSQIVGTKNFLDSMPHIKKSKVFSIPFGEPADFNKDTLNIVKELGYTAVLLSRGKLNSHINMKNGLRMIERFMPTSSDSMESQLQRL